MSAHGIRKKAGQRFDLAKIDPRSTPGIKNKEKAQAEDGKLQERLRQLQQRLTAEGKRSLLVICQGMDASGKDGLIRHVMGAFDPQGVEITSFKVPTSEELAHDFLWRIHKRVPGRGTIGIFNRSHYEDVGIVRVKKLVPEVVWRARYDQINHFEDMLGQNGVTLVKLFLHISPEEQKKRQEDRRDDPEEQWKFNPGDLELRPLWGEFMQAYGEAMTRCNTAAAPWVVIPADRKWYRNWLVSKLLIEVLEGLDPQYPRSSEDLSRYAVSDVRWP